MHIFGVTGEKVELEDVAVEMTPGVGGPRLRLAGSEQASSRVTRAAHAFLGMASPRAAFAMPTRAAKAADAVPPAVFKEKESGLLRVVYREVVIRFKPGTSAALREKLLRKYGLEHRATNALVPDQIIAVEKTRKKAGAEVVESANACWGLDEVLFATPNFVSEYRRFAPAPLPVPVAQWHLDNLAKVPGQKKGEDVNAVEAWKITRGRPSIVVAVLDDGVDVDHPNLKRNIKKNADPTEPRDTVGRDFFIPDNNHPEHFNPRPKLFQFPFDQMTGNDIHGTPCAGVIAALGKAGGALGIAPRCKVLAIKVFHADNLASDARVADAMRYAALHADVLSCSWSSGVSPDIAFAIQDAGVLGRKGKGAAVFCAAGNDFGRPVSFPASHPDAIAVGASTDQGKLASYSNVGPPLWLVAPSSGGKQGIFTTDVSVPNRGFNLGNPDTGGADGLHTNQFGGTSSATPLAAGVAALVLSAKPALTRQELKDLLARTARKIGPDHDPTTGHSNQFGFGRVDAAAAVKAAKA